MRVAVGEEVSEKGGFADYLQKENRLTFVSHWRGVEDSNLGYIYS